MVFVPRLPTKDVVQRGDRFSCVVSDGPSLQRQLIFKRVRRAGPNFFRTTVERRAFPVSKPYVTGCRYRLSVPSNADKPRGAGGQLVCTFGDCTRRRAGSQGLCGAHQRRHDRGLPLNTPIKVYAKQGGCSYNSCDRPKTGRSVFCAAHERRHRLGIPLDTPFKRTRGGRAQCDLPDCERPPAPNGQNLCPVHLLRKERGLPMDAPKSALYGPEICLVEDCHRKVAAKGLCAGHRRLQDKGLSMDTPLRSDRPSECTIKGCNRLHKGHGLCSSHLQRKRKGKKMSGPMRESTRNRILPKICTWEDCDRPHRSAGLCSLHYGRLYDGRPMGGGLRKNPRVPGVTTQRTRSGYVRLWLPGHPQAHKPGWVSQHRYVMEMLMGRRLLSHESVHHKNGDRADNRPENLELWITAQPTGQRIEDRVAHAKWLLGTYGTDIEKRRYSEKDLQS